MHHGHTCSQGTKAYGSSEDEPGDHLPNLAARIKAAAATQLQYCAPGKALHSRPTGSSRAKAPMLQPGPGAAPKGQSTRAGSTLLRLSGVARSPSMSKVQSFASCLELIAEGMCQSVAKSRSLQKAPKLGEGLRRRRAGCELPPCNSQHGQCRLQLRPSNGAGMPKPSLATDVAHPAKEVMSPCPPKIPADCTADCTADCALQAWSDPRPK